MPSNQKRYISRIYIHTSDSPSGDAAEVKEWHVARGWKDIGYHFVVLNGRRNLAGEYRAKDDGVVEYGRPVNVVGAHVAGANHDSIGVCMIGRDGLYTLAQIKSTLHLVRDLMQEHLIPFEHVFGHYQAPSAKKQGKTCPDFKIEDFRALLRGGF